MISLSDVFRLSAFTSHPSGGNPAGVLVSGKMPDPETMQRLAAEIGYSETVFAETTQNGNGSVLSVRYYSPEAEVPFCGHATIALGVHLGQTKGAGMYTLMTSVGVIPVEVSENDGRWTASLTSIETSHRQPSIEVIDTALTALGWTASDLDIFGAPVIAFGGANHLILTTKDRETLARASYNFEDMKSLMLANDLTTIDLVWHETDSIVHSRNLFAVGGVVEDPATGAAAAAYVGYLRDSERMNAPFDVTIHQGHDMGRPSLLQVHAPKHGGIKVSGVAVSIPG